ncbi:MAG: hypothetical protein GC179_12105 [Anaerolineaceae bacterium]|nr:hypothetical protein [Anaerolineaceae bacterium]
MRIKLDAAKVPSELQTLIPYAEKWGILDKDLQNKMLHEASLEEVENLCTVMYPLWDEWNAFLTSHQSNENSKSHEVNSFKAFRPVFEEAFSILGEKRPQKLLEIIKWPEAWSSVNLDSTKLPSELLPLIPFAEKWAIEDEGVRWTAIKMITDAEVKELLSIVDQIGYERIDDLIYTTLDNDSLRETAYTFVRLMELVDYLR